MDDLKECREEFESWAESGSGSYIDAWAAWQAAWNRRAVPQANAEQDALRLDFMAMHGAWVAWAKDGETCRLFHRNEDGDCVPMEGWRNPSYGSAREAIDAAIRAASKTTPSSGEGGDA